MARQVDERVICGRTVMTQPLNPLKQLSLAPRVARVFLPMMRMGSITPGTVAGPLVDALDTALAQLSEPGAMAGLANELLSGTTVIVAGKDGGQTQCALGKAGMIDFAFNDDDGFEALLSTLRTAVEVNFGKYFFGLARSIPATPAPAPASA